VTDEAITASRRRYELNPDYYREYRRRVKAGQPRRAYTFRVRKKADPQRKAKYYAANRERCLEKMRQWARMHGHMSWDERRAAGLVATKEQRLEQKREAGRLYQQRDGERLREIARISRQKAKALGYRRNRPSEKKRSLALGAAIRYLRSIGLIEPGELKTMQARRAAYAYARECGLL
jgi:hypothetical protein